MEGKNCKYLIVNAFALAGRMCAIVLFPGCRFALPRAMCSLPFQGAFISGRVHSWCVHSWCVHSWCVHSWCVHSWCVHSWCVHSWCVHSWCVHFMACPLHGAFIQGAFIQGAFIQGAFIQGTFIQGTFIICPDDNLVLFGCLTWIISNTIYYFFYGLSKNHRQVLSR